MPRLQVAPHRPGQRSPITQHRRIGLLRKLITDDTGELRARVAAILLLLYAQPLGRILRLTIDDIDTTGSDALLRLGDPPTPVPEPVAELLLALRDQRTNMRTATNRDARWLFPGRRAGQPLTTRQSPHSSATSASPPFLAAWPHCTNSSFNPRHRSSPKHSASTTPPPNATTPPSAEPGTDTRPMTIFQIITQRCGASTEHGGWMVGDDLTLDIAGGHGAGLHTIWLHPSQAPQEFVGPSPDFTTATVTDAVQILLTQDAPPA